MPLELAIDLLIISREVAPTAADIARALASAGLGVADYTPAESRSEGPTALATRQRVGTFSVAVAGTQATARIGLYEYSSPIMADMAEAAFQALTRGLQPETIHTLREGTFACDLRLRAPEPQVQSALDWAIRAVRVFLELTRGACVDPAAQRCYALDDLPHHSHGDALAHIAFHSEPWDADSRWLHTHGLQKYGRPEVDLVGVPHSLEDEAVAFLSDVARDLAGGSRIASGSEIDLEDMGAVVAVAAPVDIDHQAPHGRLRLADVPLPGERQGISAVRLLKRTALAQATHRAETEDIPAAMDDIERILAADPDDCAALALKSRLYLRLGQIMDAMQLGELMELRVPTDYRGPLTVGLALAALGRYREALNALNHAIDREPEAAEVYAARAEVHDQMGHEQHAAEDRAHAAYLSHP